MNLEIYVDLFRAFPRVAGLAASIERDELILLTLDCADFSHCVNNSDSLILSHSSSH